MSKVICTGMFVILNVLCYAQTSFDHSEHYVILPENINWKVGPPTLPPGAKFAVLEGDLTKEGAIVMRLLLPPGYEIPPHFHPGPERAIVLSGTYNLGTGEKLIKNRCKKMPAGSMAIIPAGGIAHYGWSSEETIIQVHMDGPLQITYINPDDDPRLNKK
jgi:quercetin dioxygenase-like cupin family protein